MREVRTRSIGDGGCVDYRILGPLQVEVDGVEVDLGPRKQKSLFALLLINHGHTVSTDRILEALWGDDAEGKENALWVYISRLRSALGEVVSESVLLTRDHGYELRLGDDHLDADRFEDLAREGLALRPSDPAAAAGTLRDALGLWRGHALEEFAYDDFAREEIRRLEALRDAALDARIEADLASGRGGELLGELEQLVESRPLDEQPVRHLMMALYRSGRQAEALRVFERFRRTLGEETGTEPSPELRRLEEQILFHDTRLARPVDDDRVSEGGGRNPYKGLESFGEDDAHLFFGRDALTAEILRRIDDHAIVTVVGPSGCGKSSVVRSGVVPAVRKAALPGSDRWHVATMIPGRHPFIELEAALLRSTLDAPSSLREHLDGSPDELLRAGLRVLPSDDTCLVLVIDQFEELFTLADEATTRRFLDAVVEASLDDRRRIRFLITLRADFYDRPLAHSRFGSAMGAGIVNVVPMAPEELEQAASGPAMRAGVRLESGLQAALIGDVLGESGALPLFEFALTDLYDRRIGDTLTLEAYRTMGGIDGAISRKAEHLHAGLTPNQQAAAQQMFLRLVSLSDGETRSRRRVDASELLSLDLDITDLQAVLDSFGSQRLILFDRNDATGSPTVEVSHEALLEHWDRLAGWIESATEDVTTNARLTALAAEWQDHGQDPSYLLSEGRFADYATWAEGSTMTLAGPERRYLEASRLANEDREHAEAARVEREAATARRAKRNAWSLATLVTVVVVVAAVLIWDATRPVGPRIVFVHTGESNSINEMVEGGWIRAQQDFTFEAEEFVIMGDVRTRLEEVAATGPDLIVGGLDFMRYLGDMPRRYPEVHFAFADTEVYESVPENVSVLTFEDDQGSYLMGVAAAQMTRTGRVAILLPSQVGFMQAGFAEPFAAGVQATNPDVEVVTGFVSPRFLPHPTFGSWSEGWSSPALVYEAALDLHEAGFDVVYTASGQAGLAAIAAAADHGESTGEPVWAIGVDVDVAFLAEEQHKNYVLTSMIKNFDVAMYEIVRRFLDDELMQSTVLGFTNGGVTYSDLNPALRAHDPVLKETVAGLTSGSVSTFAEATPAPRWRERPDVESTAKVAPGRCSLDPGLRIREGDVLEITVLNESDQPMFVAIGMVNHGDAPAGTETPDDDSEDAELAGLGGWTIRPGSTYRLRSQVWAGWDGVGIACLYDWNDEINWFAGETYSEVVPLLR